MTSSGKYDLKKQIVGADKSRVSVYDVGAPDHEIVGGATGRKNKFPYRSTRYYENKIDIKDPQDPLLRQTQLREEEFVPQKNYRNEPLKEAQSIVTPGLIQKYQNRALIITTQSCAIHCRYCFRKNFPYKEQRLTPSAIDKIEEHIRQDPNLNEIILSGGDPLMLKDKMLIDLLKRLDAILHIKTLRIHSRMPVVLPDRISAPLCKALKELRAHKVMVTHSNCAQELGGEFKSAMTRLKDSDVTLLNQAVLLKGVNDSEKTLIDLSHALFDAHVLPYYLHLLDPVQGTAHFYVPLAKAKKLMWAISKQLPGISKYACTIYFIS